MMLRQSSAPILEVTLLWDSTTTFVDSHRKVALLHVFLLSTRRSGALLLILLALVLLALPAAQCIRPLLCVGSTWLTTIWLCLRRITSVGAGPQLLATLGPAAASCPGLVSDGCACRGRVGHVAMTTG